MPRERNLMQLFVALFALDNEIAAHPNKKENCISTSQN
jgi:hypothetical protein